MHEPYIRHQIADTESPRAYIDNTRLWHARMGQTDLSGLGSSEPGVGVCSIGGPYPEPVTIIFLEKCS